MRHTSAHLRPVTLGREGGNMRMAYFAFLSPHLAAHLYNLLSLLCFSRCDPLLNIYFPTKFLLFTSLASFTLPNVFFPMPYLRCYGPSLSPCYLSLWLISLRIKEVEEFVLLLLVPIGNQEEHLDGTCLLKLKFCCRWSGKTNNCLHNLWKRRENMLRED